MSGRDTLRKVRQRSDRSVCDASSIEGEMPSTTPISTRKEIGVKDSICAIQMPVRPYSQRPSSQPVASSIHCVSVPWRPSSMVSARPTTKGGVMIGSTVSRRRDFLNRKPVRVATSANTRPSSVVPVAVQTARKNVRQATPQLPPQRQASDQIFGSKMLFCTPSVVKDPSKSWNAPVNIDTSG